MKLGLGQTLINTGNILSGPPGPPPFLNQYSYNFDGVNDVIREEALSFIPPPVISISVWVKTTFITGGDATNTGYIVGKDDVSAGRDIILNYRGTGTNKLNFVFWSPSGVLSSLASPTFPLGNPADGNWHHILATWDGTTDANKMQLFVDGSLIAQGTANDTGIRNSPTTNLTVGGPDNAIYTRHFYGNIDEVAIFNTDQSANVAEIYNGGVPTDLTDLSPMTWWRMGENAVFRDPQWLLPSNENKDKVSNYSMTFDGVNDYFRVVPQIPIGLLSISFWMKTTDLVNGSVTSGMGNLGFIDFGSETRPILHFGSANYQYFADQRDKFDDEWHHWFVLTTGSAQGDVANSRLFVDGIEIAQRGGSIAGLVQGGGSGYIGQGQYGYLNCDIAEFAVWQSDQTSNIATISANPLNDLTSLSPQLYLKLGDTATYNGTNWDVPETIGGRVVTSLNMTLSDRVGDAPNSINNALSINMVEVDREADVPTTSTFNFKSLLFDGISDYVDTNSLFNSLLQGTSFTVSMWFNSSVNTGFDCLMSNGLPFQIYFVNNKIRIFMGYPYFLNPFESVSTLSLSTWHHLAFIKSGNNWLLYINGNLDNSVVNSGTVSTATYNLTLGKYSPGAYFFQGNIDEVALFNTDQSANISTLSASPTVDLTSLSPLTWYRMGDNDTFPTITDNGSGGNNGTMTNMDAGDIVSNTP